MKLKHLMTAAAVGALVLLAGPLEAEEKLWQVKGFGLFIDGGFSARTSHDDHASVTIDGDYGGGLYAGIEYRPTRYVGLELGNLVGAVGTTRARYGCRYGCGSTGSTAIGFSSLLFALDIHVATSRRVDVSLGPIIGYSWFSEIDYDDHDYHSVAVAIRNDIMWGGGLDVDVRVAESNWSIAITAKYLDTRIESSSRHDFERIDTSFDPFMIGVGFGFEF
jgi:hypothetical protein